jgi:hypothetical protein
MTENTVLFHNSIIFGLFIVCLIWGSITISFYTAKELVIYHRLKKGGKASILEQATYFFIAIVGCSIIAGLCGETPNIHHSPTSLTIVAFISLFIPSSLGIILGLNTESKMSDKERAIKRIKMKDAENGDEGRY